MVLLIDEDVLSDLLQETKPFCCDAATLCKLCEAGLVHGAVSVWTISQIAEKLEAKLAPAEAEKTVQMLSLLFEFVPMASLDPIKAVRKHRSDFNSALLELAAARVHTDAIITRHPDRYSDNRILALTPYEFIQTFQKNE